MNAKTIAAVQAELEHAQWIASSPATVQAELASAQWIGRQSTTTTTTTTDSTRGANR